ncbi:hypothetical protein [Clostridium thailandense]|uniref:hypothetical protein n=1 Tax=Clostridium thailandense TaxID=2794346 RepID=UPI00398A015D
MFYNSDAERRGQTEILDKAQNLFPDREKKIYERVIYVKNHASKSTYYCYLIEEVLYQCCVNKTKALTLTGDELADVVGVISEMVSEKYIAENGKGTFTISKNKLEGEISFGLGEENFVSMLEKYEGTFLKILKELND